MSEKIEKAIQDDKILKTYIMLDGDSSVTHVLRITEFYPETEAEVKKHGLTSITGRVNSINSWNVDRNGGIQYPSNMFDMDSAALLCDFTAKWDGCSHLYFSGEDNDESGYYHTCGFSSYINHMQGVLFIYEVLLKEIPRYITDEDVNIEQLEQLRKAFTYTIQEIDYQTLLRGGI
jgi:hypothetical protein